MLTRVFAIQVDWMITAPHHGKSLVDAIAGKDKYDVMNGFIHGIGSERMDEFFKKLSESDKVAEYLNREDRGAYDTKHKITDGKRTLSSRKYEVTNYDAAGCVDMEDCAWEIPNDCWRKEEKPAWARAEGGSKYWTTQNGMSEMFHFRYHYMR